MCHYYVLLLFITFAFCGRLCFDRCVFIYLYVCYSHNSKSIKPNRMIFGGMIGYYPRTIWLDFGIDRVKVQAHEKVPKKWLRRRYALYRVPVLVLLCFTTMFYYYFLVFFSLLFFVCFTTHTHTHVSTGASQYNQVQLNPSVNTVFPQIKSCLL